MITLTIQTAHTLISTPIGRLLLLADEQHLTGVYMESHQGGPTWPRETADDHDVLKRAERQMREYFDGHRTQFDLPLMFAGTEFQCRVWQALCEIPFGSTVSYSELARRVGRPTAVRAVGAAVGRNPISIVVPCHRAVGAGGSLTGFAGGLARKRWLLAHEGAIR